MKLDDLFQCSSTANVFARVCMYRHLSHLINPLDFRLGLDLVQVKTEISTKLYKR